MSERKNMRQEEIDREAKKREQERRRRRQQREHIVRMQRMGVGVAAVVLLLTAVCVWRGKTKDDTQKREETKKETVTPTPTLETITAVETTKITVSMAGDCTIGTDINFDTSRNFNAYYNKYQDYAYFFKNVRDIFAADDLTIINMEGTLTELDTRRDKKFAFKGDPGYAQILVEGDIEAANMANNHSKDYGEQSYTDTIENLEDAGIVTFGYDRTSVMTVNGIRVGLIGIYELAEGLGCQTQLLENLELVKNEGAQVIIVSFHWGIERDYYPNETQKTLAHLAIDNGADLVVGHHPHVLQGIEEYKGKNIVYSLGNFCFGGNSNPSDKDTMIFQQTFTFEDGVLVEDNVKQVIPCCLSSTWERNDYCPTPLEGNEALRVLSKIEQYSEGLSE